MLKRKKFLEKNFKENFTESGHIQNDSLKLRAKLVAKAKKVIEEAPGLPYFLKSNPKWLRG